MSINFEKNFSGKHIIKINTKTVRELKSIAKDKDLHCYYKLKKADLVALLLDQSAQKKKKACTSRKDNLKPSRNG